MKATPGKNPEIALDQGHDTAQVTLEDYRAGLILQVREHGQEGARRADVDGFDEACALIRELAETGVEFDAGDIRGAQRVGSPQVLGAAFGALRREGVIEVAGYTIATAIPAHGRLIRRWRGCAP